MKGNSILKNNISLLCLCYWNKCFETKSELQRWNLGILFLWFTSSHILNKFYNIFAHFYVQPSVGLFSSLHRNHCTGGLLSVHITCIMKSSGGTFRATSACVLGRRRCPAKVFDITSGFRQWIRVVWFSIPFSYSLEKHIQMYCSIPMFLLFFFF